MKKLITITVLLLIFAANAFAQDAPDTVEKKLRQVYAQKYSNDFSMPKALIEDQLESYSFIQRWDSESGIPQGVS